MTNFANYILTKFLLILGFVSSKFSIASRVKLGSFIGDLSRIIGGKRRAYTIENIDKAYPEKNLKWKAILLRKAYRNLGITFLELMTLPYLSDYEIKKMIKYENINLIKELNSLGKGLILLSGHYGNWEILAYTAGLFTDIPVLIVVKPQKNKYVDTVLNEFRVRAGNAVVSMYSAARTIVGTIRKGGTLALLADQSATADRDLFVDFFGRPASTYEAPANLALKFKVPMIMGFAERQKDGTYFVRMEIIKHDDLEFNEAGILELTRRHVTALEKAIRRKPGLWAWQHRRWKHKKNAEF
ncbi:MAG: hypothetical protein WCT77_06635 [Bacteroidota bacterium]